MIISKSKLKAQMLRIFREIEKSGEEVIVTDHKTPVLQIRPVQKKMSVDEIFGPLQGQIEYREDINSPTEDEWSDS